METIVSSSIDHSKFLRCYDSDVNISKLVKAELKDYQLAGVKWMNVREGDYGRVSGGVLMDEPGLGKTLQIICLTANSYNSDTVCNSLIVCPANVVGTWKNELLKHTRIPEDKIFMYTGRNRKKEWKANGSTYKVIITSYSTVVADKHKEFKKGEKEEFCEGSLFKSKFGRIVLDEAHHIKNRDSISSKLCFKLKGKKRWVVTATPVQNGMNDLYSLFRFLGYYKSFTEWKKDVTDTVTGIKHLNALLRKYGIRRLKKDVLSLPEKKEDVNLLKFNKKDKEFYNVLLKYLKDRINKQVDKYKNGNSGYGSRKVDATDYIVKNMRFNSVKTMILRLRQACNSPQLVIDGMKRLNGLSIDEAIKELKKDAEEDCMICMDRSVNTRLMPCGHADFCDQCITSVLNRCNACPICKEVVNDVVNDKEEKVGSNVYTDSTKTEVVMKIISDSLKGNKSVIVCSQWVRMLNLTIRKFNEVFSGVKYIELTGKVTTKKRQEMIDSFQKDDTIKVAFISLMASSEGITLTDASVMVHMDPWWNSQKTLQATDRAHRIGQDKDVNVYYLFINDTIEMLMKKYYIEKKDKYVDAIVEGKLSDKDDTWLNKMIKFTNELKEIE